MNWKIDRNQEKGIGMGEVISIEAVGRDFKKLVYLSFPKHFEAMWMIERFDRCTARLEKWHPKPMRTVHA